MRTRPVTSAEVDAWLTVLHRRGHLHHAQAGPDTTWTVQRTPHGPRWTLHHPVLALDWIAELLRELRQEEMEARR
ncbi:hypothetical protein [Streptomyces buecherae]|uniref:hypothetical protein n=1 Tax=Streptomyces buecherae TaxID=2763006 RepID=UPI0036A12C50